jgi:hypothetical protein
VPAVLVVAGFAAFDIDPPFQTKLFPALVADKVDEEFVQVMIFDTPADEIIGGVVLDVTVTFCVEVHPLTGFVAVTVYVPAVLVVAGFAAFDNDPPFQTKLFPALVADNKEVVFVQEISIGMEVFRIGSGNKLMEMKAVSVQPKLFIPTTVSI